MSKLTALVALGALFALGVGCDQLSKAGKAAGEVSEKLTAQEERISDLETRVDELESKVEALAIADTSATTPAKTVKKSGGTKKRSSGGSTPSRPVRKK